MSLFVQTTNSFMDETRINLKNQQAQLLSLEETTNKLSMGFATFTQNPKSMEQGD